MQFAGNHRVQTIAVDDGKEKLLVLAWSMSLCFLYIHNRMLFLPCLALEVAKPTQQGCDGYALPLQWLADAFASEWSLVFLVAPCFYGHLMTSKIQSSGFKGALAFLYLPFGWTWFVDAKDPKHQNQSEKHMHVKCAICRCLECSLFIVFDSLDHLSIATIISSNKDPASTKLFNPPSTHYGDFCSNLAFELQGV